MRGLILATAATAALSAAALSGCYAEGDVGATATYPQAQGGVYASSPDLVTVSPGVQVVADYDEPVFFTDGFYWRFNDGYWYRSNNYYSGWYFYERPPVAVLRIDRPYTYAHYRPAGYVARSSGRYRRPEPIVRDHRAPTYGPAARGQVYSAPAPSPVVRDHRAPVAAPPAATSAPATRAPAAAPAPVVRDHRAPAKDTRDHRQH